MHSRSHKSNASLHEAPLQADELKAYSEKRMTELEKEIKDVEAAMVSS